MAPGDSSKEVPKNVILHALSMASGTLLSRVLGLFRDMALAALFSRTVTDAWTAAFRLPNLFRRLLGEGSLSVSFIPVFIEARIDSGARAQNLANGVYTLLLVVLGGLTALGVLFAEPIMSLLLAPGYGAEKFALTVRMARIMFGFVFFVSTYAYFMAILNALGKFAIAALAPTLFNIAMIVSTVMPPHFFSQVGDGLAWGVLVGGALQMGLLIPALARLGALPRISDWRRNKDVSRVLRSMLPGLVGMGLLQLTTIVNLAYASSLGEGAISYIYWADRLLELPLSLVAVSLGSALLPALSAMWNQGQSARMSESVNYYMRLNLFLAIPAALGLYVLALPIVEVLFMRGNFSSIDAQSTASVLRIYSVLLIAASCGRVLVSAYYAVKNTWLPATASGGALLLHVFLAPILMKFSGLEGLVISSCLSALVNAFLLLFFFSRSIHRFDFFKLALSTLKFLFAGVGMVGTLQIYASLLEFSGVKILSLAVTIVGGALVYFGLSRVLRAVDNKDYKNNLQN